MFKEDTAKSHKTGKEVVQYVRPFKCSSLLWIYNLLRSSMCCVILTFDVNKSTVFLDSVKGPQSGSVNSFMLLVCSRYSYGGLAVKCFNVHVAGPMQTYAWLKDTINNGKTFNTNQSSKQNEDFKFLPSRNQLTSCWKGSRDEVKVHSRVRLLPSFTQVGGKDGPNWASC